MFFPPLFSPSIGGVLRVWIAARLPRMMGLKCAETQAGEWRRHCYFDNHANVIRDFKSSSDRTILAKLCWPNLTHLSYLSAPVEPARLSAILPSSARRANLAQSTRILGQVISSIRRCKNHWSALQPSFHKHTHARCLAQSSAI